MDWWHRGDSRETSAMKSQIPKEIYLFITYKKCVIRLTGKKKKCQYHPSPGALQAHHRRILEKGFWHVGKLSNIQLEKRRDRHRHTLPHTRPENHEGAFATFVISKFNMFQLGGGCDVIKCVSSQRVRDCGAMFWSLYGEAESRA